MNDGVLLVNFGSLQNAGGHINAAVNKLEADLADLDAAAQPLLTTWSGEAQAAYHQRQKIWTDAARDLKTILHSIKNAVEESAVNYQATEKRATDRFS
jgi:6 kDa early secretory antigenic target